MAVPPSSARQSQHFVGALRKRRSVADTGNRLDWTPKWREAACARQPRQEALRPPPPRARSRPDRRASPRKKATRMPDSPIAPDTTLDKRSRTGVERRPGGVQGRLRDARTRTAMPSPSFSAVASRSVTEINECEPHRLPLTYLLELLP